MNLQGLLIALLACPLLGSIRGSETHDSIVALQTAGPGDIQAIIETIPRSFASWASDELVKFLYATLPEGSSALPEPHKHLPLAIYRLTKGRPKTSSQGIDPWYLAYLILVNLAAGELRQLLSEDTKLASFVGKTYRKPPHFIAGLDAERIAVLADTVDLRTPDQYDVSFLNRLLETCSPAQKADIAQAVLALPEADRPDLNDFSAQGYTILSHLSDGSFETYKALVGAGADMFKRYPEGSKTGTMVVLEAMKTSPEPDRLVDLFMEHGGQQYLTVVGIEGATVLSALRKNPRATPETLQRLVDAGALEAQAYKAPKIHYC